MITRCRYDLTHCRVWREQYKKVRVTWYPAALEKFLAQSNHIATFFPTKMSTVVCNLLLYPHISDFIYYIYTQIAKKEHVALSFNQGVIISQLFLS